MRYKSIKGTRDILPEESYKWQYIEEVIRSVMRLSNFQEIRTPMFEATELFERGIGQFTDIVTKEMYTFKDRGGKSLTLKPEMTAPVIRSFLENTLGERRPLLKLYYISPAFRQENPQAGRLRQFHQFGVEVIGSPNPDADVESIAVWLEIYRRLGVRGYMLKLNSVGDPLCREPYKKRLQEFLRPRLSLLCKDCEVRLEKNPLRILDCKREGCREATADAPALYDHLCDACRVHFEGVRTKLEALDIRYDLDKRLVRGLDYYTRTAFEIVSGELGAQDALGGGGRYDLLAEELGGKPTPAVGFAAGFERLLMVMASQGLEPEEGPEPNVFLAALGAAASAWAMVVAQELRRNQISCDYDFLGRSLKAQMRESNRLRVRFVVIVGEDEVQRQTATVRDMTAGEQSEIAFSDLVTFLRKRLSPASK
jgi:histidyl-tRNA synthetase